MVYSASELTCTAHTDYQKERAARTNDGQRERLSTQWTGHLSYVFRTSIGRIAEAVCTVQSQTNELVKQH